MTLKSFLAGCWFGHDRIRERGAKGSYWLVCATCGDRQQVLAKQKPRYRDRSVSKVVPMQRKRAV